MIPPRVAAGSSLCRCGTPSVGGLEMPGSTGPTLKNHITKVAKLNQICPSHSRRKNKFPKTYLETLNPKPYTPHQPRTKAHVHILRPQSRKATGPSVIPTERKRAREREREGESERDRGRERERERERERPRAPQTLKTSKTQYT